MAIIIAVILSIISSHNNGNKIGGLAIGLAVCILILLLVQDEINYDQFHKNGDQIYRIMFEEHYSDGHTEITKLTPALLCPTLKEQIPEIVETARFLWEDELLFKIADKKFIEKGRYADASLFQMFSFPFVEGNPAQALKNLNSVVISETLAKKMFGSESALGKTVFIQDIWHGDAFTIEGVFKDIPEHSSLRFDFIIPLEKYLSTRKWALKWGMQQFRSFIQVAPNALLTIVQEKIENFTRNHAKFNEQLFLQPYEKMYLYSNFQTQKKK